MANMVNKVALITGSGRGIGRATALKLAQMGYSLCINYKNNRESAESLLQELKDKSVDTIAVRADVSEEKEVLKLFDAVEGHFGGLSVLVNNAGIMLPQTKIENIDASRLEQLFRNNLFSAFYCCREAVKRMRAKNIAGVIVNVSSAASRTGSPNEYIDYAATKGAMDTLTIGLANEVAKDGIRVVAVRPGFIDTTMHADGGEPNRLERLRSVIPLGRGGAPEEVANTIAWLVSDQASYITNSIIDVAGGR